MDSNDQEQNQTQVEPSISPSPPKLPPRTNASSQVAEATSALSSSLPNSTKSNSSDPFQEEDADSLSVLSTSSKSQSRWRWSGTGGGSGTPAKPPSVRRRKTGESTTGDKEKRRSRRTSETGSVRRDDEGNLTPALELEIQGNRREQERWGVGDDVAMGLD